MTRRVLLICYCYPPTENIGALRPAGLAKYLPEFGWEVTVLTPRAGDRVLSPPTVVIETDDRDIFLEWKRRLRLNPPSSAHYPSRSEINRGTIRKWAAQGIKVAKELLSYPDRSKGWVPFAVGALPALSRGRSVDAIISTAHPITCHLVGARAKQILKRPWVADFRDLWFGNANGFGQGILGRLHRRLERNTLASADALVTVSPPLAELLARLHPDKRVESITNGFDPDDLPPDGMGLDTLFSIVYTGSLYDGRRDPSPVLQALKHLVEEQVIREKDVRIQFYGDREHWLVQRVRELKLGAVVDFPGRVPRIEVLRRQRSAQVLLLLGWDGPTSSGVYTGKIFEYLNAARPILMWGGEPGVASDLLRETGAGMHATSPEAIRRFLLNCYAEYRQTGCVPYRGRRAVVDRFNHRSMAGEFARLLNGVI